MARITKALREQIVRDFVERNGGWFDPAIFLAEVRKAGPDHPAYEAFEWDDDKAAEEFRIDQARDFTRGLTITFQVQTVHRGSFRVIERSVPLAVSPVDRRKGGGGYFISDPNDPAHMVELCQQAAQSLRWFISRYGGALTWAGVQVGQLEKMELALEAAAPKQEAA